MAEDSEWFRTATQLSTAGFERDGRDWIASLDLQPRQGALDLEGAWDRLALIGGTTSRHPECYVPLYEAKMIHHFDHRWATYGDTDSRNVTVAEKANLNFEPTARYWVPDREVAQRLAARHWTRDWLMGWRDMCRSTDERTTICSVMPRVAVGNTPLIFLNAEPKLWLVFLANLNSLALDFIARLKVGGTHLTYTYLKQFPIPPPSYYSPSDIGFILPRVLELTYTSHSMTPFARDLDYDGSPFSWNDERRAQLRAELDAWYARAYGLTRDELRFVLDPADVKGPDYPSETFRVLKKNVIARFGEYRTARLVLAAYDQLTAKPLAAE
jgi:hypothetical protein